MNSKGFASVFLLALLPLLLAVSAVIAAGLLALRVDAEGRHKCRAQVLQSQTMVAEKLNELLALNPEAQTLRLRRKQAETAVMLAPTPEDKLVAEAYLEAVIAEQMVFGARQGALIAAAKAASLSGPSLALAGVRTAMFGAQWRQGTSSINLGFRGETRAPRFDLVASPANSPTPDYKTPPGFEDQQLIQVRWSARADALLPLWLHAPADSTRLQLNASCAATVEKGNGKWHASLRMDKH